MTEVEWNDRRGFVFHDACWSLLEQSFYPAPVPLVSVFEVCDSLPKVMAGDCINWGHDYGGLALLRDGFFPWEDRFEDRPLPDSQRWSDMPYNAEPLAVSEVDEILADTPLTAPGGILPFTTLSGHDPFNSLPVELCSAIVIYLPTPDVLNARLASRSFWYIFSSQQFWGSRFRGALDRSWLFEARHFNHVRDWRWLYYRTTNSRIRQGLQNRKKDLGPYPGPGGSPGAALERILIGLVTARECPPRRKSDMGALGGEYGRGTLRVQPAAERVWAPAKRTASHPGGHISTIRVDRPCRQFSLHCWNNFCHCRGRSLAARLPKRQRAVCTGLRSNGIQRRRRLGGVHAI